MIRFRALHRPVADCKDASLAVQSDLKDTLIPEIMRRFAQSGDLNLLMVNNPESRVVDGDVPSLQDSSNLLTQIKERYNVEVSNGFTGTFVEFGKSLFESEARKAGEGSTLAESACSEEGHSPVADESASTGQAVGNGTVSGQSGSVD